MPGKKGEKIVDENGNVTYTGGLKAAQSNKERYGENYYRLIGHSLCLSSLASYGTIEK